MKHSRIAYLAHCLEQILCHRLHIYRVFRLYGFSRAVGGLEEQRTLSHKCHTDMT
jgi:hypothetical protein